jgi:hypothetical protein
LSMEKRPFEEIRGDRKNRGSVLVTSTLVQTSTADGRQRTAGARAWDGLLSAVRCLLSIVL